MFTVPVPWCSHALRPLLRHFAPGEGSASSHRPPSAKMDLSLRKQPDYHHGVCVVSSVHASHLSVPLSSSMVIYIDVLPFCDIKVRLFVPRKQERNQQYVVNEVHDTG